MQQSMQASGEALVKLLNEAAARIRASTAETPALPASSARFATQPVFQGRGTVPGGPQTGSLPRGEYQRSYRRPPPIAG